MSQAGKMLLIVGAGLMLLGAALWLVSRLTGDGWRGLPGDIVYQSGRGTIIFPIATCLLVSLLLTLLVWLWQWMNR